MKNAFGCLRWHQKVGWARSSHLRGLPAEQATGFLRVAFLYRTSALIP